METIKCPRCGKTRTISFKQYKEILECEHCHQKMILDGKSLRKLKYLRMGIVILICGLLMWGLSMLGTVSSYLAIIIACSITLLFAQFSDGICLGLTAKFLGVNYVSFIPQKKSVQKKAPKKKHSLFKK